MVGGDGERKHHHVKRTREAALVEAGVGLGAQRAPRLTSLTHDAPRAPQNIPRTPQ